MKKYNKYLFLIIAALIISITSVSSQDLVVITNNDSINCKIIQLKNNRLTFAVYKDDETIEVSYPEESIETFQKDFYKKNDIPDIDLYNLMKEKPKAYLLIGGGYSQFIKSSYYINYYDNLNRGFYINLDLGLFLNYGLGFGLKYEFFRSEGYGLKSYTYNGWNSPTTIKGDRVLVLNFIAPSILLKLPVKTNNDNFILNLSPGYLHYSTSIRNFYRTT